jgi:ubiquinone/menaquinone biosynthesis C-methylase UbiE
MNQLEQARAWDRQGEPEGPITPIYRFVAKACSQLVPQGGTAVDLGCGTGRFASYLARLRPDIKVIGLDLSDNMLSYGNSKLRQDGISDRVSLLKGDMKSFTRYIPPETSIVTSIFALHHLDTLDDVKKFFIEVASFRSANNGAFAFFDLTRPRHSKSPERYPLAFTPKAAQVFQMDSTLSLRAAYSHSEILNVLSQIFDPSSFFSVQSKIFPLYQMFWTKPQSVNPNHLPGDFNEIKLSMTLKNWLNYFAIKYLLMASKK